MAAKSNSANQQEHDVYSRLMKYTATHIRNNYKKNRPMAVTQRHAIILKKKGYKKGRRMNSISVDVLVLVTARANARQRGHTAAGATKSSMCTYLRHVSHHHHRGA